MQPIARHFPHWCCYARVPHAAEDSSKWRLWLTFCKSPLLRFYRRRSLSLVPGGEGVMEIDLTRSRLHFPTGADLIFERREELLSAASVGLYDEALAEHERRFEAGESVDVSMSGEAYWLALLSGMSQFEEARELAEDNVYLRWLARGIEAGKISWLKPRSGSVSPTWGRGRRRGWRP